MSYDHEGHAHSHDESGHSHSHGKNMGATRLVFSIIFNFLITAAEFVAGVMAGSLTLLADAAHNLSDTVSLGISLAARRISNRDADRRRTFGYDRAELIGAFLNLTTLVIIALYLLVEALRRFWNPNPINGNLMLIVGAITLAGNVATAFLLAKPAQGSLNIKSAFVHIIADALGSVAVILGGWLITRYGWRIVDPILTMAIAIYILAHSLGMLKETIGILMESAPEDFDFERMMEAVMTMDDVQDIHHVHIWRLDENRTALEAHVAITRRDFEIADQLKNKIKMTLEHEFGVSHATLEIEHDTCTDHVQTVIADE